MTRSGCIAGDRTGIRDQRREQSGNVLVWKWELEDLFEMGKQQF
jgi:hypothetical protein